MYKFVFKLKTRVHNVIVREKNGLLWYLGHPKMFFFCCKTLLQHLTVLPLLGYLLIPFMHPITLSLFDISNLLQLLNFKALPRVPFSKMVIFLFVSCLSRWFWLKSYLLTELSSSCGILAAPHFNGINALFVDHSTPFKLIHLLIWGKLFQAIPSRICFLLARP